MSTFPPDSGRRFGARPIAYLRLPARQPEVCARFACDMLGLEPTSAQNGEIGLRSDERVQSLMFAGADDEPGIGVDAGDEAALESFVCKLESLGRPCLPIARENATRRRVQSGYAVRDASGNQIELIVRPQIAGRRFRPAQDNGLIGLTSLGLRSRDIVGDLRFWAEGLGAEISDRVGEIAYLRFDDAHHRIALYPSDRNGPLYASFAVASFDDLMRNVYFLQERQVRIVHGPGCETASGRVFVRFAGPEGLVFAFEFDAERHDIGRRARQFALERASLCAWGSVCSEIAELSTAAAA